MDPFGDNSDNGDLSSFQAPVDPSAYANDFYEVDSGEAAAAAGGADQFGFGGGDAEQQSFASYASEQQTTTTTSRTASFEQQTTVTSTSRTASFEQQQQQTLSSSRHSSFNASGSRTSSFGQSGGPSIPVIEEENELTKFLRVYEQQVAEKALEQEKVAHASKDKAQADMAQFAAERVRIKEAKQQSNRVREQATLEKLAADLEAANPWERVVSLVDLEANRKQKLAALGAKKDAKDADAAPAKAPAAKKDDADDEDVTRMRQLFVQLKADPLEKTRGVAAH